MNDLPPMQWHPDVVDPVAQLNIRSWLQKALEAKGAKITGGGCGVGGADLDFTLEGCKFNVVVSAR